VFSAHATKIEVCLFDLDDRTELERIELREYTDELWRRGSRFFMPRHGRKSAARRFCYEAKRVVFYRV